MISAWAVTWRRRTLRVRLPSLYGVWMVCRYQRRGCKEIHALAWTLALVMVLLATAFALSRDWVEIPAYDNHAPRFLLGWLVMTGASGSLLLLPGAAFLGARAVPTTAEFESTQSALLTRLTAFEIVAGRLLAALWPLMATMLLSCAFWLSAQLGWRFIEGSGEGYAPIFLSHLVVLAGIGMVGSLGFLFAERKRPGRSWGRGVGLALLWATLCVLGIFLVNPLLLRLRNPARLIEATLLVNPVTAVVTSFGAEFDILRDPSLYDRTNAHDFQYAYPPALATAGAFLLIGLGATSLSAACLRRAYR